jgi:predicted GNAT superfamily acetyltransferase
LDNPGIIQVRDVTPADVDWLLMANNAVVPGVNHLERNDLADLLQMACYARLALVDGVPAGALIGLWPGAAYASANYRWFCQRFTRFFYVDRVMVADGARGKGIGRALYADVERFAKAKASSIALEVNSLPPNPVSLRFHQAAGFAPVGELAHDGGAKKVVLMMKALDGCVSSGERRALRAFGDPAVAAVFASYPDALREKLLALRDLIHEVAAQTEGVGRLEETLKWGQPGYQTPETKSGSTIRLGVTGDGRHAGLFVHCRTTIVSAFRNRFPDAFRYQGERAILFKEDEDLQPEKLRACIAHALTYHLKKRP